MTDYRARIREALLNAYEDIDPDVDLRHVDAADALAAIFRDLTRDLSEQVAQLRQADADRAARELLGEEALRFVAARYNRDGSGANFRKDRCTGVSSDALAWFAVGRRDEPAEHEYPRDRGDLAACERTYDMAPDWLKQRMAPVLMKYRVAVAKDDPELVAPDAVSTPSPVPASDDARKADGEAHSGSEGVDGSEATR